MVNYQEYRDMGSLLLTDAKVKFINPFGTLISGHSRVDTLMSPGTFEGRACWYLPGVFSYINYAQDGIGYALYRVCPEAKKGIVLFKVPEGEPFSGKGIILATFRSSRGQFQFQYMNY